MNTSHEITSIYSYCSCSKKFLVSYIVLRNNIKILKSRGNFFFCLNISFSIPGNRVVCCMHTRLRIALNRLFYYELRFHRMPIDVFLCVSKCNFIPVQLTNDCKIIEKCVNILLRIL